jgi:hypothetical protein
MRHIINTNHIHLKELDSLVSNLETSITTSKSSNTPHMSKLESEIVVLQDHLKSLEKDAIIWASRLKDMLFMIKQDNT